MGCGGVFFGRISLLGEIADPVGGGVVITVWDSCPAPGAGAFLPLPRAAGTGPWRLKTGRRGLCVRSVPVSVRCPQDPGAATVPLRGWRRSAPGCGGLPG